MDLQQIRATVETLIQGAGAEAMRYWGQTHQEKTKANIFDIVTEADTAVEAMIVPRLQELFPDHHFVGEEGGGRGKHADEAEYFWYIDPIDGTTNFANDLPFFCVSIGMSDRTGQPLVGAVFNPVHNELFSAARGQGATLNGKLIHVRGTQELNKAVLTTGFSPTARFAIPNIALWERFIPRTRALRRFGSVALELSYIAAGRLDGMWEPRLNPWDITAGLLLVTEAGGTVSDYSGGMDKLYSGEQVVASNGLIHTQMLEVIQGYNSENI